MKKENNFSVGGMYIELFLLSEKVEGNAIIIPKLPHGSRIVTIVTGDEDVSDCDAVITENRGLSLGIRTADCASICFSDGKMIGIAHIGWRGLCLGLIEKMLVQFGKNNLEVYVGPFLHSFEIQKDFCYEQITEKFGERYIEQRSGKLFFNFKEAISSLLPSQAVFDARNTESDLALPSYRRDKTDKRFTTVVNFL